MTWFITNAISVVFTPSDCPSKELGTSVGAYDRLAGNRTRHVSSDHPQRCRRRRQAVDLARQLSNPHGG